jgi:glycosyltransferase involved in cell wall biosynthesis
VRVAFVVPGYARKAIGGIRVVYNYANGLAARGHDVSVVHVAFFSTRPSVRAGRPRTQAKVMLAAARDVAWGAPDGVPWQAIDPGVQLLYAPVLADRYVPDGDAVVATAWQTADGVAGLDPAKGRGCYLIQHHETWSGRAERVDETWRLPLRKIFIAPWLETRALDMGLDDVHRVPGAIDTDRFRVASPIASRPRRIAMLSSGWAWKGLDDGIRALDVVHAELPDVAAVLFGTAPRPARLPAWIEYQHDPAQDCLVADVYNGSSIYLCPSHAEGWHLPPAEAMACGCAVVSTAIDGVSDYARDEQTALLSPVRDPDALAVNLLRLLRDDRRRIALAQAGHGAMQQFRWDDSTRALEAVLFAEARAVA